MGAGNHEIALAAEKELFKHLRQGMVKQLAVERGLGLGISPGNGVADDDHIRVRRDIFLAVAFRERDPLAAEEIRHRRIDVGVGTGDGVTALFHGGGDGSHGGATDPGEVKFVFGGHRRARG